jgi:hypothetical protein
MLLSREPAATSAPEAKEADGWNLTTPPVGVVSADGMTSRCLVVVVAAVAVAVAKALGVDLMTLCSGFGRL